VAPVSAFSAYNALNQLTGQSSYSTSTGAAVGTGSSAFGYDGDGNMSLVTAKDASGTVTGQTSYTYDDASRLIGITTPGSSKWQFVYDGLSRLRVSRSWKWTNGAWVQDSEKRRVYRGMRVVQERDQNNAVIVSYCGRLARSTASGTVFYGFDGRGNVTTLTDATGSVVGSYTYDAWGNLLASSGAKAGENLYRFSGKEQLAGMSAYGFRFYSSGLGRWINRDPIRESGGTNVYAFVGSNPVNKRDAHGFDSDGSNEGCPAGLMEVCRNNPGGVDWVGGGGSGSVDEGGTEGGETGGGAGGVVNMPVEAPVSNSPLLDELLQGGYVKPPAAPAPPDYNHFFIWEEEPENTDDYLSRVGDYGGPSIPARGPGNNWNPDEKDFAREPGFCHSCGTTDPGTKSGSWTLDHQPPSHICEPGEQQNLFRQCKTCMATQGGSMRWR